MSKTILVVDDSASIRQVVSIALKGAGYDVIEACDGKDALTKMTGQKIHLIVSDVNMPNMDGLTFVKSVRQQGNRVPMIMVTTEAEKIRVIEAIKAGVNNYVVKPFTQDQLGARVKETLEKVAAA